MSATSVAHRRLPRSREERVNWVASIPFLIVHAIPVVAAGVLAISWQQAEEKSVDSMRILINIILIVCRYSFGMFFVTAGYHRYFSHSSYELNRFWQFVFAFCAVSSGQKGTVWWSGSHKWHHVYSDQAQDKHTPLKGFWWSHVGWILADVNRKIPGRYTKRWDPYPELAFLDRYYYLPPATLALIIWLVGGWSGLIWGFFGGTVLLYHCTFLINSGSHLWGNRRFSTADTSRNNFLLAIVTFGEGWHNNHHYDMGAARQGLKWWEIDITYYGLCFLKKMGIAKNLRQHNRMTLAQAS